MKQSTLKTALAAGIALLMPLAGYSQAQLGGTTADKKMQGNSSSGSAMGGLYTPSLYDGTANINIPIYQYSADGGNYGISLAYNTRGVKVDELAGPVGSHWNLIAGGTIQRVVKDVPDDVYDELEPYIEPGELKLDNPETKLRGRLVVYGETTAQAAETGVYRDRESDDYIVSVGNLSFTFNLGKDGYVFTIPQRNVKVELLYGGIPVPSLQSIDPLGMPEFRITDEQGNRYFFEVGDYRSESVKDKYGYDLDIGAYTYATSWAITKVITTSGAEINYTYSYESHAPSTKTYSDVQFDAYGPGGSAPEDMGRYKRLESIVYPNGITAVFQYDIINNRKDDFAAALKEIKLLSNGLTQLKYKLNQSYWVASGMPTSEPDYNSPEVAYGGNTAFHLKPYYRLKLNSISIVGTSGPEEPFYSFEYSSVRLPKRFHGSQDYFGYYNGKTPVQYSGGTTPDVDLSIPYHTAFNGSSAYGVNRDFDIAYAKAGILTKIKNAFGGQVEFQYGANVLQNVLNATNTPGLPLSLNEDAFKGDDANDGLRLDATIESDVFHVENYRRTSFVYSGGQRFLSGGYFRYPYMVDQTFHIPIKMLMTNQYTSRHQLVNGANHGYSFVGVRETDENNNQLSRTEYSFTNFLDGNGVPRYQRVGSGSLYFFEFPFSEKQFLRDWEMGLPLRTKYYDQNDRISLETNNIYTFSTDITSSAGKIENSRVASVRTDYVPVSEHEVLPVFDYTDTYRPFRGKVQLMSSQTKKYISDNAFIDDMVSYKYDGHNNITYSLAQNSKGEYFKTENIYNYDLDMLLGSGLQAYTDAGLEKVVSTQRWKTDATGNTYTQLMDGFINTFDYSSQQVKPKAMYTMIPGDAISRSMYTGYSGGGPGIPNPHPKILQAFNSSVPTYFRKASEVILSDAKGNPLESRLGDQDIFKAMIWDDVTGQKLAEAGSCHYAEIAYCGFETPATGTVTKGNITYDASNVIAEPPSGSIYGAAFKLSIAPGTTVEGSQTLIAGKEYILSFWTNGTSLPEVYHGSTLITLPLNPAQTYDNQKLYRLRFTASSGDKFKIRYSGSGITYIDDVRLHPVTAQMQHWSYTPMFGAAISTDVNGRSTFVNYDGQGRPRIVRDKDGNIISKTEYGIQ